MLEQTFIEQSTVDILLSVRVIPLLESHFSVSATFSSFLGFPTKLKSLLVDDTI